MLIASKTLELSDIAEAGNIMLACKYAPGQLSTKFEARSSLLFSASQYRKSSSTPWTNGKVRNSRLHNPLLRKRLSLSHKGGRCTFPVALFEKQEALLAEENVSEREGAFIPLSERFKREQGLSTPLLKDGVEYQRGQENLNESWQTTHRQASHFEASTSGRENPQSSTSQSLLEEVHRDLRGKESTDEGPVFDRDEEWEASVFLWKKPKPGPREAGSIFPGTPGPAYLGDERRYFVEDTGKQLRIKRLGRRDKHGPIREERERRRELERQWLEENYGVKLPPTKGVKNVVNRIGGWKVVGQGWVERRRDVEIANVAKSVGLERALVKERFEREAGQTGVERNTSDEGAELGVGSRKTSIVRKAGRILQEGEVRKSGSVVDVFEANKDAEQHRGEQSLESTQGVQQTELDRSLTNQTKSENSEGALLANEAESLSLEQEMHQQSERRRLQAEGTVEEVDRHSREAVLEHLQLKYGKLHVGRLWRQSKIEADSGWLQVYHDNVYPGHGLIALEPFPESAPVLQDQPPQKYKRPYPVSTKMRKRLDSMPKALLKPPLPEAPPPGSVWVRGRPVKVGTPEDSHNNRGPASRGTRGEKKEKFSGRAHKLSPSGKGLKGKQGLEEGSSIPQPASLGLKVLEGRFTRLRRLKRLKAKGDPGWFEAQILAAVQSRISLVVDGRDEAERAPVSEVELEAVDSVGLVVHQKGHRERVVTEAPQTELAARGPSKLSGPSQEKASFSSESSPSSSNKESSLTDSASGDKLSLNEKEGSWHNKMQLFSGGLHKRQESTGGRGVAEQTKEQLKRTFHLLALRVSEAYADKLALRLEGHLLHWPRISNVWDCLANPGSVTPASDISLNVSPSSRVTLFPKAASRSGVQPIRSKGVGLRVLGTLDVRNSETNGAITSSARIDSLESLQSLLSRPINRMNGVDSQLTNEEVPPGQCLLLLSESVSISYLPRALHVLLGTCPSGGGLEAIDSAALVACELTLDHTYWTADEVFNHLVSSEPALQVEYMGHIAVLCGKSKDLEKKRQLGQVLVDKSPHVRTVIAHPASPTSRPTLVAGEPSFFTTTAENGVKLELDMGAMRFDPGLAAERQRLLDTFTVEDVVCDASVGIGALSVAAAKRVRFVHASDPNPSALCYLARNAQLNGTERNIRLWQLEAKDFVREIQQANPPCFMTHFVLDLTGDSWEALGGFDRFFMFVSRE